VKKVLCLILTLSLVMILGSVSFAAAGGTNIDEPVPGAPTVNVETETYVPDEDNAGGSSDITKDGTDLNEVTPGGDARLPKTGGIPAETFYSAGALIVLAALILSRKKVKASSTRNK
jgi:LPXTG-motif cell wall-anchored protein